MNDKILEWAVKIQSIAGMTPMTENGMNTCDTLRLKWLWNEPTFLSIR